MEEGCGNPDSCLTHWVCNPSSLGEGKSFRLGRQDGKAKWTHSWVGGMGTGGNEHLVVTFLTIREDLVPSMQ